MARKKTTTVRVNVKAKLSARLKEIRQELFGEHGGPEMARRLGLPARTWYNYETGVTVPAEVLLGFIDQTGVDPLWLYTGQGPKYRRGSRDIDDLSPIELIRHGLEKLRKDDPRPRVIAASPAGRASSHPEGLVPLRIVPLASLARGVADGEEAPEVVLAARRWIPNPSTTVAVRLDDPAMDSILPPGSIVAIDLSARDPLALQGRLVAAAHDGQPIVRVLEISGRHLILRPIRPGRDGASVPIAWSSAGPSPVIGQVVWSWTQLADG